MKHLILRLTNGDGYTNPLIDIFNERKDALSHFNESIGNFIYEGYGNTVNLTRSKTEGTDGSKYTVIMEDVDEDENTTIYHTAVHHLELVPNMYYVLGITCNYVDEFSLNAFDSYMEAERYFKNCIEKVWDDSEEISPNTFFGDDGTEFKYYTVFTTY